MCGRQVVLCHCIEPVTHIKIAPLPIFFSTGSDEGETGPGWKLSVSLFAIIFAAEDRFSAVNYQGSHFILEGSLVCHRKEESIRGR